MNNRTHLSAKVREIAPAYAIAIAAPICAALLRAALSPLLKDRAVLMIYLVAVLFAASRGGLGPGLVSTAISLGFGAWTYLQFGGLDSSALTHLGIFFVCAVAISFIGRAMRQAIVREHRRTVDLRVSEVKHRRMADCGLIGLIEWRAADGVITDANDLFLNLVGYPRSDLRDGSLRWRELTPPEHHAADARSLEALRTRGVVAPYEKEFFRKDGSRVWVLIGNARYEDSNGGFSVVIDIAERKRADEQLRRNRDTFYNLIQNNPFGIYVVDADFRLRQASLGSQKVFQTVHPLLGRDFAEVIRQIWAEPFATQAINLFRHTLETGEPYSSPSTVERREDIGEMEAYDWRIERITLPDGRHGVVCYFYDLSERQKLEAAVRESEERFKLATRATSDAIWDWDLVTNTAWWNEGISRLTGYPAEEVGAAEWWLDKIHPDDRSRVQASIHHAIDHGATTWREEYRFRRSDGTYAAVLDRGYVLRNANGKALRMIGGMQDLTERHRAEQALRESEAFYRKTLESIPGMVFTTTADGQCDYLSRQWIEFTGIEEEPQLGLGWLQVVHPDDRSRLGAEWVAAVQTADCYETEYRIRNREGRYAWFKVRARAIRDSDGQVANWLGTASNVEDFKRTESTLRRTQEQLADANDQLFSRARQLDKLVEQRTEQLRDAVQQLETFSYSIVHDMRAPLRSMRSFAQLLVEEYSENLDPQARQYLGRIQTAAGRMDALITDVLSYSRISSTPIAPNSVDLDRLLHDMVEQYPQLQENASAIEIASPLPRVSGNPALLTQVFSNLLGNALKFIPRDRAARVAVRAEPSNGHVRIWVEDNGIGIRPEHRDQIFGLFQRLHTNEQYPGTGVGLAIVRKAVERMGGNIGLESEEGQGTRFWVDLRPAPPKEKSLNA